MVDDVDDAWVTHDWPWLAAKKASIELLAALLRYDSTKRLRGPAAGGAPGDGRRVECRSLVMSKTRWG